MAESRVEMEYTGKDGRRSKVRESTVTRLRHVARHHSVGRFLNPPERMYRAIEVRAIEDSGLWEVEWLEPADLAREGAWCIRGLTPLGQEVLEKWERVVERGEGAKGPQRTRTTTDS